jgi:hypothetical protein
MSKAFNDAFRRALCPEPEPEEPTSPPPPPPATPLAGAAEAAAERGVLAWRPRTDSGPRRPTTAPGSNGTRWRNAGDAGDAAVP